MDKSKEQIQEIFNTFDKDGSGTIEKEEIRELATSVGVQLTEAKLKKIINTIDTNGDGKISFEEFYEYFQYGVQKQMDKIINAKFKHIREVKKLQKTLTKDYGHIFDKNIEEGRNVGQVLINVGQVNQPKTQIDVNFRLGQENKHYSSQIMKNFPYIDENIVCLVIGLKCNNSDKVEEKIRDFIDQSIELAFQMMPEDVAIQAAPFRDDLKIEYKALPDELLIRIYVINDLIDTTLVQYRSISSMFLSDQSSLLVSLSLKFLAGLTDIAANPNENLINLVAQGFKADVRIENSFDFNETAAKYYYGLIGENYDKNQKIKELEIFTPLFLAKNARIALNFQSFKEFVQEMDVPELDVVTLNMATQQAKEANIQELLGNVPFVADVLDILRTEASTNMFISTISNEASLTLQMSGEGVSQIWDKLL